jgi:hypothetical protein
VNWNFIQEKSTRKTKGCVACTCSANGSKREVLLTNWLVPKVQEVLEEEEEDRCLNGEGANLAFDVGHENRIICIHTHTHTQNNV